MAQENNELENNENSSASSEQIIANLKAKCEEYLNGWKRERADFLNYKKEEMERIGELAKYTNEEIILKIIPILDNICLAARQNFSSENLDGQESACVKKFFDGLDQIIKQFNDFLLKEGIEVIKVLEEKFDPNTMEAIEEVPARSGFAAGDVGGQRGVVVEEIQRGYTLHGKIIRPAKVKISK